MRITTSTSADVVGIAIKRNKAHDGKEAYVDLDVGIKQEQAADFGDDFGDLAFSSMREKSDEESGASKIEHLQDSIKPSSRVVHERHVIVIDGNKLTEQPELMAIKTVDGEARVVARYRVPISTNEKKLLSSLVSKVGGVVAVEFNPEQEMLDLTAKPETLADPQSEAML